MKKTFNSFCLFIFLTSLISCKNSSKTESVNSVFTKINSEVLQNSQAYGTLKEASEAIGHRLTGSENGKKAEEYTFNKFKEYGFEDVVYDEFEVEAWARKSVTLSISDEDDLASTENLKVVSLGHSPVKAQTEAEIIDMGNGLAVDYETQPDIVKGKIALVYIGILPNSPENSHNLHRSEKTALAIQNGAIGIIIFNQVDNGVLLTGTASVDGKLLTIPAICIGKEDGFALKERLKEKKLYAKIDMENSADNIKARNVIATIKGAENPEEVIILGGHLDSWDLSTGAIDNGIGSFAILDIARTFISNNLTPKRTIKFVMFMGEEQGLLGSRHMVSQMKSEGTLGSVKYMFNMDMLGNPIGFSIGGKADAESFFRKLGHQINEIDTIFKNDMRTGAGLHSDHQPFMVEGIPTASMIGNLDRKVYECYHSDCDDFSLVNKDHITNTVRFGTMAVYGLANADTLPSKRLDDLATKQFFIEHGLKEKLVLGGDWKWD